MFSESNEPNPDFTHGTMKIGNPEVQAIDPVRGPIASNITLGQNYPNPFNPTTTLPITLGKAARVEVTIHNELGNQLSHEEFTLSPGAHSVPFDGTRWSSGNYFARVKAGNQIETKRMTLIK